MSTHVQGLKPKPKSRPSGTGSWELLNTPGMHTLTLKTIRENLDKKYSPIT